MHKNLCFVAALVVTVAFVAAQKGAQENPLFRVQSELVLVDLIVTGKDGNPIDGLGKNEVEVFEDGKKQKLQFFEFLTGPPRTGDTSAQASASPSSDPVSLAGPSRQTSLTVVLDLVSLEGPVLKRVKESLAEFLSTKVAPETRVMLASYRNGLQVHQPFTQDRAKLSQALQSIQSAPEARSTLASFRQFSQQLEELFHGAVPGSEPAAMAATQGKVFVAQMERRMAAVSGALSALTRFLRALPGRKQVMFYSSGYPLQPMHIVRQLIDKRTRASYGQPSTADQARQRGGSGRPTLPNPMSPDVADMRGTRSAESSVHKERMAAILSGGSGVNLRSYLQGVIDQANRSQVSFYTIDARGLVVSSVSGEARDRGFSDQLGVTYLAELREAVTRAPQEFLIDLADDSGGLAFLNSNDLSTGLERAQSDARSYYLLGYRPKGKKKKGKFHTIEIKVKRPGTSARYRRGYLATDPQSTASDDVMAALSFPELFATDPFEVHVENRSGGKMAFNTIVPTRILRFREDGGKLNASVEIFGILLDQQGKWVGENVYFSRGHQFNSISEQQKEKILSYATFSLAAEADTPQAGEYQLVVVIRQGADGTMCTHRQQFRVGG